MMLIVEKFPWANTLEVTRGVEAAFAEMGDGLKGIDVDLRYSARRRSSSSRSII